jgi:hypothetical protein
VGQSGDFKHIFSLEIKSTSDVVGQAPIRGGEPFDCNDLSMISVRIAGEERKVIELTAWLFLFGKA